VTGDTIYRDAAIADADALVRHVRAGDATHSPWPFRVDGRTGDIREEYTSSVVGPVRLFDELVRLNVGDVAHYQGARDTAWTWVLTYPLENNEWHAYYEDVPRDPELVNYNQLTAMETARYILDREDPSAVDPQWRTHVPALIDWVGQNFGRGPFWGAQGIDEQTICCETTYGLGSDTARWASINARLYELTGDARYKDNAFRTFNLATYFASQDGVVASVLGGPLESSSISDWFSDSYADYVKHFMYVYRRGAGVVSRRGRPLGPIIVRCAGYRLRALGHQLHDVRCAGDRCAAPILYPYGDHARRCHDAANSGYASGRVGLR